MAHGQPVRHGIFALENMNIGTANCRRGYFKQGIIGARRRNRFSMSSILPLSIKAAAFIMRMVEDPLVSVEVITRKNNPNGYFFYFNAL